MKTVIAIFAFILTIGTVNCLGCWCRHDPEEWNTEKGREKAIKREFRSVDFVFSGTVVEDTGQSFRFKVLEMWKGDRNAELVLPFEHMPGKNGEEEYFVNSCAYYFDVGKT